MIEDLAPYTVERPGDLRARWEQCPPAGLRRASTPTWHLERWKRVRELIAGWYNDVRAGEASVEQLIERLCGDLDPVQRQIVEGLFRTWTAMYPSEDGEVDLDPPPVSVYDHERRVELRVRPTVAIGRGEEAEYVRLRTGRSATNRDEAAVLTHEAEPNAFFSDAMVALGAAEEIVPPVDGEERRRQLIDLASADRRTNLKPGRWCFRCDSASRCGQYPTLGPGRSYISTRSVVMSKTQLGSVSQCERRVAWSAVHQIPADDQSDEFDVPSGRSTGIRFHEMAAAATGAEDPAAAVAAACSRIDPAEAAELHRLWDNHLALVEAETLEVRGAEYPVGITMMVDGVHVDRWGVERLQPVAVTMIGILDQTGREEDGLPMVIEHRTGSAGTRRTLEPELYAAAASAAARRAKGAAIAGGVAVHFHQLGRSEPTCDRLVFDEAGLETAHKKLREAAELVAGWHPMDSLQPAWSVGEWCETCPVARRCSGHR